MTAFAKVVLLLACFGVGLMPNGCKQGGEGAGTTREKLPRGPGGEMVRAMPEDAPAEQTGETAEQVPPRTEKGERGDEAAQSLAATFERARTKAKSTASLSNMKQLCLAMHMYMNDWDRSLPPADKWSDALMPYIGNKEELLRCPLAPDLDCGYAFNEALDSGKLNDVADPAGTVVLFTSNLGTRNAIGGVDAVADPPRTPTGNIYGYVDGHAKIEDEIPNFDPSKGRR